jgi:hypothetical protein
MEKLTEFLKKNWIWVLIAVAVVAYLLYRNRKKTESSFKATVRNTEIGGWHNVNGLHALIRQSTDPNAVGAVYTESTGDCLGTNNWKDVYNTWGNPASLSIKKCGFKWTNGDKVYLLNNNQVKKIKSWGDARTWTFYPDKNGDYPYLMKI